MKVVPNKSASVYLSMKEVLSKVIMMPDFCVWLTPRLLPKKHKKPKLHAFVAVTTHTHTRCALISIMMSHEDRFMRFLTTILNCLDTPHVPQQTSIFAICGKKLIPVNFGRFWKMSLLTEWLIRSNAFEFCGVIYVGWRKCFIKAKSCARIISNISCDK